MGSLDRRLAALEEKIVGSEDELQRRAAHEFVSRLTDEELHWLNEPCKEAAYLVPCPHVERIDCGCMTEGRQTRGLEAHPELYDEYARRYRILYEQREEILLREPWASIESRKREERLSARAGKSSSRTEGVAQ